MIRKSVVAALIGQSICGGALLLISADVFAHKRVEQFGGVNVHGYRGLVMKHKQPHEIRLAVVGGDLAFGWGVAAADTMIFEVRRLVALDVDKPGGQARRVTAVNLAAQGLAASGYPDWIARFAYLQPDVLVLLPDPPAHEPAHDSFLPDRRSFAFRAAGYAPILPLVIREKAAIRRSAILERIASTLTVAQRLGGCGKCDVSASSYGDALDMSVRAGLDVARAGVAVVWPPRMTGDGVDAGALRQRFASNPRVRFVDLTNLAPETQAGLFLNPFDFSSAGHGAAAAAVAPAALALVGAQLDGTR